MDVVAVLESLFQQSLNIATCAGEPLTMLPDLPSMLWSELTNFPAIVTGLIGGLGVVGISSIEAEITARILRLLKSGTRLLGEAMSALGAAASNPPSALSSAASAGSSDITSVASPDSC